MKDNKYYVPDLTEFRVGFRYEVPIYGGNWELHGFEKKVLTDLKDITIELLPYVRCKYLDESDILELGFKQTNSYSFEKIVDNTTVIIDYTRLKETPYVQIFFVFEGNQSVRFTGRVKNYNELEVILKQIGV